MKLNYRGIEYDYNPTPVDTVDTGARGKYRGLDWRFRNPKKTPVYQTTLQLKYRGIPYGNGNSNEAAAPAPTTQPAVEPAEVAISTVQEKARALMYKGNQVIKKRQQAMLSRSIHDVGMDEAEVGDYWNRIQGKVHPTFRVTYGPSRIAHS
ncbi:DUF4278 domain-containing protein [Geitlerinema sp. PCC 9228]|jgi:hypothetical protein|uniref:DUF4278 domain-containing protein n=1 Tax=Geitlerinema sp. PCC 9228 TaxID=111611 RepID=UPI0008F99413|nr:DUF4278 domain-containing protein [Geitlerinema sp. PCC 9228]